MSQRHSQNGQAGFTLIELMISVTVVSIAIAAAFTMAYSLMNGFKEHRQGVQVESTSRIVLDILSSGVRASSPGLPSGRVWDPCIGANIDTIAITNSSAGPDSLRIVHALGGSMASLVGGQSIMTGPPLTVDATSGFEVGLWTPAVIVDPLNAKGHLVEVQPVVGVAQFTVRGPGGCAITAGNEAYSAGSFVIRAVHMQFSLNAPYLMVDPDGPGMMPAVVMAEGIEDLQIAIGVENGTDTTSLSDTAGVGDEWHYNATGDMAPPLITSGQWRAMRITIVGYTIRDFGEGMTGLRPQVEDRSAAATPDQYRRRTFSTTIELRNLGDGL